MSIIPFLCLSFFKDIKDKHKKKLQFFTMPDLQLFPIFYYYYYCFCFLLSSFYLFIKLIKMYKNKNQYKKLSSFIH